MSHWRDTPIFIPNRDNLDRGFRRLVEWLVAAGQRRIVVLDNASTYPPLLEYYRSLRAPVGVRFSFRNLGPNAPWMLRPAELGTRFIVSDPDVVPAPECPHDLVARLHAMMDYYSAKVGPGLRIDNLPDCYAQKRDVLEWEKQFWLRPLQDNCYQAPIDTTFALYPPGAGRWPREAHLRLGPPYVIEHVPWYEDSAAAIPERDFYRSNAAKEWNHW